MKTNENNSPKQHKNNSPLQITQAQPKVIALEKNQSNEVSLKNGVDNKKNNENYEKKVQEMYEQEVKKHSSPMWLTNKFVEKPFHVVGISCLVFIISLILTFGAGLASLSETNSRDYLIFEHESVFVYDMLETAKDYFYDNNESSQLPERSYLQYMWSTSFVMECDKDQNKNCNNILTPEYIQSLAKFENKIKKLSGYGDFCLATTESSNCSNKAIVSITSMFKNPLKISQSELDDVIENILSDSDIFEQYKVLFDSSFQGSNKKSKILRSIFDFGAPLVVKGKLKRDQYDDEEEQEDEFKDFSQKILDELEKFSPEKGTNILPFSYIISELENSNQSAKDFIWAGGSIMFVWFYLTIHLKSFFLSSIAMFNIVISFPISLVILKLVCQVSYFSTLHILAVFIILGIAADNIFVFIDCWRQALRTPEMFENDERKMMAFTFRRASHAMLATSSTTAAAFFATGFSSLRPISSFGIFSGILVPVNFLLVVLFFPSIIIIHEHHIKGKTFISLKCLKKSLKISNSTGEEDIQNEKQEKKNSNKQEKEPILVTFFDNAFNNFVFKFRIIIMIIFTVWTCIAIWRAVQLEPISEMEEFLPSDHHVVKASKYINDDFHKSANLQGTSIDVSFFWGTKGINKKDVEYWDSSYAGEVIWDNSFDLTAAKNQQYIYDFCLDVADHAMVLDENVECFMIPFKQYLDENQKGFPVLDAEELVDLLLEFSQQSTGYLYWAKGQIGIIEKKIRYIEVVISSKGELGVSSAKMEPLIEDWQDFKDAENKISPKGLQKGYQTGGFSWIWVQSEKAFASNAYEGMVISLVFAFIVLMITTHNIFISLYSVICILGIVMSVICIMELQNWELGISESITIVIVIGLSVDYVVHLANHYTESVYPDRFRKIKVSLRDIGISIISGAITTLGSGCFLFFAVIVMFNKFAILIVSTIMFSLGFALLYFTAIMHFAGPEGDFGNYIVLFKKIKQKYFPKKLDAKDQQQIQNSNGQIDSSEVVVNINQNK